MKEIDYRTNVDRVIYIGDVLYTLSDTKIVSYDLNSLKKMKEIVILEPSIIYYFL